MEATAKAQRRRVGRKSGDRSIVRIEVKDGMGNARWVTADLVDLNESGFGVVIMSQLEPGSTLAARGRFGVGREGDTVKVGVRWCTETSAGTYRVGLEFVDAESQPQPAEEPVASNNSEALDCYEVMQLSPNADADTIARVYRMLAMRYHPDNPQTGNSELFVRLSEAHAILADPLRRAAYDVKHLETKRLQWKIYDQAAVTQGSEGEVRKRQGILGILYAKALVDPEVGDTTIQMIEELLGTPREHLKAAMWYLKGKNFIKRSDNGRYSITIAGFEEAEAHSLAAAARNCLQLPAAKAGLVI